MGIFRSVVWQIIAAISIIATIGVPSVSIAETDITSNTQLNKGRLLFDRRTSQNYFDVTLTNISQDTFQSPVKVIIDSISDSRMTVANPDGITGDGKPYFDYSGFLGDGAFDSQETSQSKTWRFNNPYLARFTYQTRVVAEFNNDTTPPAILITNPVSGGVITNETPLITVQFSDAESGIDSTSFHAEINGVDQTSLFYVSETEATGRFDEGLTPGANEITASISNNDGLAGTADSSFAVSQSDAPDRYLFSLQNNPWIFSSSGNGTYDEHLFVDNLGVSSIDLTSLALDHSGNYFFTQSDIPQITESNGAGSSFAYLTNSELGVSGSEPDAIHLNLNEDAYFSLPGSDNILFSTGDSSNSQFVTNSDLGVTASDLTALHIDYDGLIYFVAPPNDGVLESAADGSNTQFLSKAELGVPGSSLDAFAMIPDSAVPSIAITSPMDGAFLNTTTPSVSVAFSDDYSGIDFSTFALEINSTDFTGDCTVTQSSADCRISTDLPVGANTIVAKVSDRAGNESSAISDIQIGILRAIPGATPTTGTAPLTVHFTTDGEDPAGTIEIFRWDFYGDGSWDTYDTVANDYNRTFNTPGTYTAVLYVRSSTGESATETITITVQNNPPTATADVQPSNGEVPLTAHMTGSGTDSDGSIVLYEWDFDGDGTYDWSSTTTGNTSYNYTTVGTYQAVFRVTDDNGLTATAVAPSTIVRAGPPGSPTATAAASPMSGNAPLNVNFNGTATDPDNDIVLYEWDFDGDGTYDWSSATLGSTSHTYNTSGTHEARFRVTDSIGLTGIDQVLITVNIQTSLSIARDTVGFLPNDSGGLVPSSASASSYYSSSYSPNRAIDNNNGTYWQSARYGGGSGSWFEVSFYTSQVLSGITINWYSSSYKMNRALIAVYDSSGTELYSQEHDIAGVPSYVNLPNIENAARLRLTTITSSNSSWLVIREFQYHIANSQDEPTGTNINTSLSAGTQTSIVIKNSEGNIVRTLVNNEFRDMGTYSDYWDCKDDNGFMVNDGVYYAVLEYLVNGQVQTYDLTTTTGGSRYVPSRQSIPSNNNTAAPFNDQMLPIYFSLSKASEVTLFVGVLLHTNTRVRTIYNRVPLPAGSHTAWWDGLDDNENIAQAPSSNYLILGIWGYNLPDNAMYVTGGRPKVSNVAADPNYYDPFSEKCDQNGNGEGITLSYILSEDVTQVELKVYSLETGNLVRTATHGAQSAGENIFFWDGKDNSGKYVTLGDYQIGIMATDGEGNNSMYKYTLARILY